MKNSALFKYISKKIEGMTVAEVHAMMTALGFSNASGSFKCAYIKKGCEFVIKIFDKEKNFRENVYTFDEVEERTRRYLNRELGLNEFADKFRVPIFARGENSHFYWMAQEKVTPLYCKDTHSGDKFYDTMDRFYRKVSRDLKDHECNLDVFYNTGRTRNGQLLCFDGL